MKKILFVLAFTCLHILTQAQNIEELGVKKGVKVNGSVSINTVGYVARGIESRRDPFNWFVSGNLNLTLFGYSAPFSFSYSNANKNFTQPFNQFSFTPQYKWIKTYIGYNSMTFSSYTLAGHVFLGGGVELTPGKWKIAAMYGRLKKATPYNISDSTKNYNAAFKRMGTGLKLGYDNGGDFISASVFTAKDDVNSIPYILPDGGLTPKENLVMGVSGRKRFLQRLFIEAEYAYSILNNDTRADKIDTGTIVDPNTGEFIKGAYSSRYFNAYNASFGYQGNSYSMQVKYEKVDPEYQTLGAYYFNNDMENITFAPSVQLFQQKVSLAGNVGFQRNNLDKNRASTTERFVGSFNASFLPNENWNFSGSYSNFSTYTNIRPQIDPFYKDNLDTLNFYQINNSINGSIGYNFGSKEKKHGIMLNVSYQKATDEASYADSVNLSSFYTGNISYSYSLIPSNITASASFNYYTSATPGINSNYWGPNASISKALLEKTLRATFSSSYNFNSTNGYSSGSVLSSRLSLSYAIKSSKDDKGKSKSPHNFSLGINFLQRFKGEDTEISVAQKGYSEFTSNFTYTYSF